MELREKGTGIDGILYAAPISDFVAVIVSVVLTIPFFKSVERMGKIPCSIEQEFKKCEENLIGYEEETTSA